MAEWLGKNGEGRTSEREREKRRPESNALQVGLVLNVHTNCAYLGSNICERLTKRRSSTFRARNSGHWASGCVVASA